MKDKAGKRYCGVPLSIPMSWPNDGVKRVGRLYWHGPCQNPPMRGMEHCRHHLTPSEQKRRYDEGRVFPAGGSSVGNKNLSLGQPGKSAIMDAALAERNDHADD